MSISTNWHWRDHLKLILGGGLATIATAFIVSPFLFLDFSTTLANVQVEARSTHLSATGMGLVANMGWYISDITPSTFTVLGLLLIAAGIMYCLLSRDKSKWLLVLFPLGFLIFISTLSLRWDRWLVPDVPFFCIFAAAALYELARLISSRGSLRLGVTVSAILFVVLLLPLLGADIVNASAMSGADTRTLADQWIVEHIPPHSKLLVEVYTPQLPVDQYQFYTESNGQLFGEKAKGSHHTDFMPGGHIGRLVDLSQLDHVGVDYIVMSDIYARYVAEKNTYPIEVAVYQALFENCVPIYELQPIAGIRGGPPITVYKYEPVF